MDALGGLSGQEDILLAGEVVLERRKPNSHFRARQLLCSRDKCGAFTSCVALSMSPFKTQHSWDTTEHKQMTGFWSMCVCIAFRTRHSLGQDHTDVRCMRVCEPDIPQSNSTLILAFQTHFHSASRHALVKISRRCIMEATVGVFDDVSLNHYL